MMEDESHLLWGDTLGYVWGTRNTKVSVQIQNQRERQTYYGAINILTGEFFISPQKKGDGENTVKYIEFLREKLGDKKILIIWDGASYHRYSAMQKYLEIINQGLPEKDWKITCLLFAPNAPEQNPVEDIWLSAKNYLRSNFIDNITFAQVKKSFLSFLQNRIFEFPKLEMYRKFIL